MRQPHLNNLMHSLVVIRICGTHGLAVARNGRVYSWGVHEDGALGRDTSIRESRNQLEIRRGMRKARRIRGRGLDAIDGRRGIPEETVVTYVTAGDGISIALINDSIIFTWGTFKVFRCTPPRQMNVTCGPMLTILCAYCS